MELLHSAVSAEGHLEKMRVSLGQEGAPVSYQMLLDGNPLALNPHIGKQLRLRHLGPIQCRHCGRATKKSFNQGYCYPCFTRLAQCDSCIVSPEKCHFHEGTCREPEWGEANCMVDHIVYLANSSGIKVGITRQTQLPTRWIDQGAVQALPVLKVQTRQQSGLVEALCKVHVNDRTNWRAMLRGGGDVVDLAAARDDLLDRCSEGLKELEQRFGPDALQLLDDAAPVDIHYPVLEYPTKVTSFNLDKNPEVEGTLLGIKGQYLIFDSGVINLRKYTAYRVAVAVQ
ncbi:MAG: DUF2797 domain-containing protein [Porticoccaceae bacterium]|nr:DUF2797 domain-containing protein [Porticoccaceae bacterium]